MIEVRDRTIHLVHTVCDVCGKSKVDDFTCPITRLPRGWIAYYINKSGAYSYDTFLFCSHDCFKAWHAQEDLTE